jgi:hypothetical protein
MTYQVSQRVLTILIFLHSSILIANYILKNISVMCLLHRFHFSRIHRRNLPCTEPGQASTSTDPQAQVSSWSESPRAPYSAFWIDAFSFWIGCENGPLNCEVTINGYEFGSSTRVVYQDVTIPPCPELKDCKLTFVELGDHFRNLTGVQILAAVNRQLAVYYLDDVSLAWSDNTCAAQTQRTSVR